MNNYYVTLITIATISFFAGIFKKGSDHLYDEQKSGWVLAAFLGMIWGCLSLYLILISSLVITIQLALILYWLWTYKIDQLGHNIAVTIILFGIVIKGSEYLFIIGTSLAIWALFIKRIKNKTKTVFIHFVFHYQLHLLVFAAILSFYISNAIPFIYLFCDTLGYSMTKYVTSKI